MFLSGIAAGVSGVAATPYVAVVTPYITNDSPFDTAYTAVVNCPSYNTYYMP